MGIIYLPHVCSRVHTGQCMGKKKTHRTPRKSAQSEPSWWDRFKKHWKIFIGPGVVALGMQLMSYSSIIGIVIVYAGVVICICEIVYERWFIDHDLRIQVVAIGSIAIFGAWLTITTFPVSRLDLKIALSTARRNPKVSELHVLVRNGNDSEYQPLNLTIKPNGWISKMNVLSKPSGCELGRITERAMQVAAPVKNGDNFITYSNVLGDIRMVNKDGTNFYEVATKGAFQIYCPSLPPGFVVHLAFDVVAFSPRLNSLTTSPPGSLDFADVVNPSGVLDDLLDNAPCLVDGKITGTYKYELWHHDVSTTFNLTECKKS
jgi:hypothetical protein